MDFKKLSIDRVIIHKIIGKSTAEDAYSIPATDLHKLDPETTETLIKRITNAVKRSRRLFETTIKVTESDSFFSLAKDLPKSEKRHFIKYSASICQIAAAAHQNANIPGGLLIVIEGQIDKFSSVIVVKAELQEAMTLRGNSVELMKELFLSPAKEFYKIGLLVHKDGRSNSPTAYQSFVYDDNFTPKRNDIAEYFYKDFLGFSTSENDKLLTNNFLKDFDSFVEENITDHTSRKHLKISIKADYRESSVQIVDPQNYLNFFDDEPLLKEKFERQILSKFPRSFTKDLSLVETSLKRVTRTISGDLKLTGPPEQVDGAEIIDQNEMAKPTKLVTQINSGAYSKVILIPTMESLMADKKGKRRKK
jgi:hypothetical protein